MFGGGSFKNTVFTRSDVMRITNKTPCPAQPEPDGKHLRRALNSTVQKNYRRVRRRNRDESSGNGQVDRKTDMVRRIIGTLRHENNYNDIIVMR